MMTEYWFHEELVRWQYESEQHKHIHTFHKDGNSMMIMYPVRFDTLRNHPQIIHLLERSLPKMPEAFPEFLCRREREQKLKRVTITFFMKVQEFERTKNNVAMK
jgi:hypothetical protein